MKISIEGPIGAGKSTFARALHEALPGSILQCEPDEKPGNPGGHNPYLSDYYTDPARWALTMQLHLMSLRVRQAQDAEYHSQRGRIVISDRSLPGDLAFARVQRKRGIMSEREFATYKLAYKIHLDRAAYPDVVIRLQVSPDQSLANVAARMTKEHGRECESSIPRDYLVDLNDEIEAVLREMRRSGVDVWGRVWPDYAGKKLRGVVYDVGCSIVHKANRLDIFGDL